MVILAPDKTEHLIIHRMEVDLEQDRWRDGITWDELQDLKSQCGRGDELAVEVYPKDKNLVNKSNHRHLWIIKNPEELPYVWANLSSENGLLPENITQIPSQVSAKDILSKTIW